MFNQRDYNINSTNFVTSVYQKSMTIVVSAQRGAQYITRKEKLLIMLVKYAKVKPFCRFCTVFNRVVVVYGKPLQMQSIHLWNMMVFQIFCVCIYYGVEIKCKKSSKFS